MKKRKKKIFWKTKWLNKTCGISKARLRPGKNKLGISYCIFLQCSHGFYRSVLKKWIENCPSLTSTCPLCRKKIQDKDIVEIFR